MKQRWNVVAVVAVIMLVALAPLAAQTSNTKTATAGIFTNEIDNIVSTTGYSSVIANKWFGFTNLTGSSLDLGYATKFGDIYLGTYYSGSMLQQAASTTTDSIADKITVTTTNAVVSTSTTKQTVLTSDNAFITNNAFKALVGIAGHGIGLGFAEKLNVYAAPSSGDGAYGTPSDGGFSTTIKSETTDSATKYTTKSEYSNTSRTDGYMTPSVTWGSNFAIGNLTLSPEVAANFVLNQDNKGFKYTASTTKDGGVVYGATSTDKTYKYDGGNFEPKATVAATLKTAKVDGAQLKVKLSYDFDTQLYADGAKKTTIDITKTTPGLSDVTTVTNKYSQSVKTSYMKNTVTPSVTWTKDLDDALTVGVNVNAAIALENKKDQTVSTDVTKTVTDSYSQNLASDSTVEKTVYKSGDVTATDTLTVVPAINFAFKYKIIPSKFDVKAGLAVTAPNLTNTTKVTTNPEGGYSKSTTTDGTGKVTATTYTADEATDQNVRSESREVTNTWAAIATTLYFGSTFNFNEKFALDFSTKLGSGASVKLIDESGTSGLLTNGFSLSFIIKN